MKRNSKAKHGGAVQSRAALDPAEWDFGRLEHEAFDSFLRYEFTRSSLSIRNEAERFFSAGVKGKSVRHLFHHSEDWSEAHRLTKHLEISFILKVFLWDHPAFPEPWLSKRLHPIEILQPEGLAPLQISSIKPGGIGFDIVEALLQPGAYTDERRKHLEKNWFVLHIDWERASKQHLVNAFSDWIDERKSQLGIKRGLGGDAVPWHKLKALSALRLSEAGMTFDQAREFLKDERKRRNEGMPLAWPQFEDASAWSRAKRLARREILAREAMFGCSDNSKKRG